MVKKVYEIGQEIEKRCAACGVEQIHTVKSLTKAGQVSKAVCSVCARVGAFKTNAKSLSYNITDEADAPYSQTKTYRKGQSMMHSAFGYGEVTAVVEPKKIDVLFEDRLRRLVHSKH